MSISGNPISRFITIRVPKDTLGQPASGWGFTVVLTGQDGFSRRPGARLPADAAGLPVRRLRDGQPRIRTAPWTRPRFPKLMDVITPAGVDQSDEVDYTLHTPVVLSGVVIP